MPQTLFEKIWNTHLVARRADGRELIYIDRHVLHELHAPHAFEDLEKQQRPVRRPDLTFSAMDHTVATKPGRDDNTNPSGAAFLKAMREGSARNRIKVFDLHDPEQGISHVVAPELGMVLPGATHAVPDSHASTVGGVGALAFGCGTTELAHILATQVMAMKRPKRMLARLDGKLSPHVTAKDVALRIIAEIGVSGARGHVVEYAGSVIRAMPIEQRMTLCNLNIEMGGRSGFVAPGNTMPSSGATTCEMPCSGSCRSKTLILFLALPSRIALRKAAPDGLVLSSRPGLVATVWSTAENVRSGRRTGRCCFSSSSNACGACSSCST